MHFAVMARWLAGLGVSAAGLIAVFHGCSSPTSTPHTEAGAGGTTPQPDGAGLTAGTGSSGGGSGGFTEASIDSGAIDVPGAWWTVVPGSEFTAPDCKYYQAAPGTLTFPPLTWTPCGTGCQSADPKEGYAVTQSSAISASVTQGIVYLQYGIVLQSASSTKFLSRIAALPDGVPVAALVEVYQSVAPIAPCTLSQYARSARFVEISGGPGHSSLFGFAPTSAQAPWIWAYPAQPTNSQPPSKSSFVTDSAYFYTGSGGVFSLLNMQTSSDWTTIEAPSESKFGGGDGDLAVWTEWDTARIRAWAPDGKGVRTLLEAAPTTTWLVQPSATRIVGLVVDADYETKLSTSVRFWHMPRTYDTASNVTTTPTLASSVVVPADGLRTWGDYAGVVARDTSAEAGPSNVGWLLVAQLSTGKAWRVEAEPGYVVQQTSWAFDDTWLFFGETLPGAAGVNKLHRIRRIRLTDLSSWAKPMG